MSTTLGLVFSNIHDGNIPELTTKRTVASIPFFGRYRLIDFALSNMVNSDIVKVGLITKSNYQSLMDHVGSGKDWDLARHYGGLFILPPFGATENNSLYTTRFEALKNVIGFLNKSDEEYVVLSDSDMVCNIDFRPVVKKHGESHADVTMIYVEKDKKQIDYGENEIFLTVDKDDCVKEITYDFVGETANLYTNVLVVSRLTLINLINDGISHGKKHFVSQILKPLVKTGKVKAFRHEGYYEEMTSLQKYYDESMKLLKREYRDEIFRKANVYTKVKDSAPTRYGDNAIVKNSLIADGCDVEGEVYNSIIFRGVKIGRGTVVKNCILMQNTLTGESVDMNCIIADKNVVIKDKRVLSGSENHPFFISKGTVI